MIQVVRNMFFVLIIVMGGAIGFKSMNDNSSSKVAATRTQPERPVPGVEPERLTAAAISLTNQMILRPSRNSHYYVTAQVEGVSVRFLVDTGATSVVLSMEDAENIGLDTGNLTYSQVFNTANGQTRAAPVVLEDITIGQLSVDDVQASVNQSDMGISLLGMTFLRKLDGYQVEDGNLVFYW